MLGSLRVALLRVATASLVVFLASHCVVGRNEDGRIKKVEKKESMVVGGEKVGEGAREVRKASKELSS